MDEYSHGEQRLRSVAPLTRRRSIQGSREKLENQSILSRWLLPRTQFFLAEKLHIGNEQVYLGRNGWLFYRPDVEYVTGPPFLDSTRMKQRAREAGVAPDPLKCIVDFRNQLAARGIDFIAIPAPVKPCIDGAMLSEQVKHQGVLQNASFSEFKARLEREGVHVFDPAPLMMEREGAAGDAPSYLETDTHWRPETMEFVAQRLAALINVLAPERGMPSRVAAREIAAYGDIFTMLKLPAGQTIYNPQKITIKQVLAGNALWRPNKQSRILLLGDSFCNIFSLEPMGWGESGGFAEHLSLALGSERLDCILRNSDASFATREILSRELAHGRDRLAGKKIVLWEFAVRELAFGNWKLIDMKIGQPQETRYLNLKPGEELTVTGTVEAVSPVPLPGSVPYKDHIFAVHLADITGPQPTETASLQALVYMWSMRDNVWTAAARLRIGDRVAVRLRAWADFSERYEKINRTEIDDATLQLEEPVWGELQFHTKTAQESKNWHKE
jgi:SGNH hydrolase-like domain, acetyltransferase AlgX